MEDVALLTAEKAVLKADDCLVDLVSALLATQQAAEAETLMIPKLPAATSLEGGSVRDSIVEASEVAAASRVLRIRGEPGRVLTQPVGTSELSALGSAERRTLARIFLGHLGHSSDFVDATVIEQGSGHIARSKGHCHRSCRTTLMNLAEF